MSNLIKYSQTTVANDGVTTFILDTDSDDTVVAQDTRSFEKLDFYIDVSATPSAGTMAVSVRPRGGSTYRTLPTSVNLVGGPRDYSISAIGIDAVKFTPSSFDAGKTYDVRMFGKDI